MSLYWRHLVFVRPTMLRIAPSKPLGLSWSMRCLHSHGCFLDLLTFYLIKCRWIERCCFTWDWCNIIIINCFRWWVLLNKNVFYCFTFDNIVEQKNAFDMSVSFANALKNFPVFNSLLNCFASIFINFLFFSTHLHRIPFDALFVQVSISQFF